MINIVAMVAFLYLLIFNPLNFVVYAVFCFLYGVGNLVEGGKIIGLLMALLSYAFLYKIEFFKTYKKLKNFIITLVFLVALGSQYRFGIEYVASSLIYIFATLFLLGIGILLFLPELLKIRNLQKTSAIPEIKEPQKEVLRFPLDQFTRRDMQILQGILRGEKYEKIGGECGMALITLKKHVKVLFEKLDVKDRTEFLLKYVNYSIALEVSEEDIEPELITQ
jgi:DNA-binding CsgD family transcriptional regulator